MAQLPEAPTHSTGSKRYRCAACLFELNKDLSLLPSDSNLEEEFVPNFQSPVPGKNIGHKIPFSDLIASASRGCHTCKALVREIEWQGEPSHTELYWHPGEIFVAQGYSDRHRRALRGYFQVFVVGDGKLSSELNLKLHPYIALGSFPTGDTRSLKAFQNVERLMKHCLETHGRCASVLGENTMPERLLFIESLDPLKVKLIEHARTLPEKPYACLSHRWGSHTKASSLTKTTSKAYQNAIPEDNLYSLLQDAIETCHRLGIQYIWVDCLCIYQDDLADWEQHVAEMDRIYENAMLTISALSCPSDTPDSSMFAKKTPMAPSLLAEVEGEEFFIKKVPNEVHPFRLRHRGKDSFVTSSNTFPLNTRGWSYQEQLLSKRIIHFTENEVIWICRESFKCECGFQDQSWDALKSHNDGLSDMDWKDILMDYTSRKLSIESDRLPALSGIAKRFGSSTKKTYLAGLWWEDLDQQLMWTLRISDWDDTVSWLSEMPRKLPTWSWVSIAASAQFIGTGPYKVIQFISHEVSYGLNPYGVPESAKLIVESQCLPVTILYGTDWSQAATNHGVSLEIGRTKLFMRPDYDFSKPGDRALPSGTEVLFLIHSAHSENLVDGWLCGLALVCIDPIKEYYQRVGLATSDLFNEYPNLLEEDKKLLGPRRRITLV